MNVFDALQQRRSVKHYDPSHELTDDEIRTLLTSISLSPTSFNMQNRHTVLVRDPEVKAQLKAASWGQSQVADAAAVFVLTGALEAHKRTDRYLRNAPEPARKALEPMIGGFYDGRDDLLRDEACRTIGLAGMSLMLQAKSMGYDSCPMIGFDPVKVSEILGLDANHPPLLMVVVGKALTPAYGRMGMLDFEETVSVDRFGNHAIEGEVPAE